MELVFGLDRFLISSPILMATEETTKESKPHGGASRQRDTSHRDRQKNPGTSTTPIRPNPGSVHDTEMVSAGLVGRLKAGDFHWRQLHGPGRLLEF